MSALLSAAPTVASATLLTQYTPYFRPIPTVLPSTFTNPSLPLHPKHHNSTSINAMNSLASELCTPPSTGALTRFLAVQYLRYHRYPYVDAVPQGTCSPAGSRIPYEIYAPRNQCCGSLDTPTVRSPMERCLPCAQKLGCLRLGRNRREISTPLT